MISLVNHCSVMASLSGTTSHYSMFSSKDFQLLSLNRLPEPLRPQMRIDKVFELDNTYIDVYNSQMLKKECSYGNGVIWVEITNNLVKYVSDNNMKFYNSLRSKFVRFKNWLSYRIKQIIYKCFPLMKSLLGR